MALSGTEVLQVQAIQSNGQLAATTQQTTTGAIAALANAESAPTTFTSISTVGDGVLTAASIVGGGVSRSGPTSAFTDTTDTAVALVAALPLYVAGETFDVVIKNLTAFPQTLAAGTGVTLSGSLIVPANSAATYLVTITSATAVAIFHISTTKLSNIPSTQYSALTNTSGFTLTAAGSEVGAADCTINLTGTLGAGANVQSDTAANIVAGLPNARAGNSYRLRIINSSSANFAWTLTTNTGITLTGTMTMAQNTYRDFYVTLTSLTAVAIQAIGTGTQS